MIDLGKVLAAYERRSVHFLELVQAADRNAGKERDRALAYVAVEMQTALGYVARSAFLAGTLGGRKASGGRMPRGSFGDVVSALMAAARVVRKKPTEIPGRDEPSWHSADHIGRVATTVAPSNGAALLTATSAHPNAMIGVSAVRNFYAHRAHHTRLEIEARLLAGYGLVVNGHPSRAILARTSSAAPLVEHWVWNYLDIAELLCER